MLNIIWLCLPHVRPRWYSNTNATSAKYRRAWRRVTWITLKHYLEGNAHSSGCNLYTTWFKIIVTYLKNPQNNILQLFFLDAKRNFLIIFKTWLCKQRKINFLVYLIFIFQVIHSRAGEMKEICKFMKWKVKSFK